MPESRNYNPEYYDAFEWSAEDAEFYSKLVTSSSTVLELGCGTGRVSGILAQKCKHLTGVEISESMLHFAKQKNKSENISFVLGDITKVKLPQKYNLVIAPYRVLQCLEYDSQVHGLFKVIRQHLEQNGLAILNIFNPKFKPDEIAHKWVTDSETFCGQKLLSDGDVLMFWDIRKYFDEKNQVLHPELIYRRYRNGELIDTHINQICMKYWYPDQFMSLVESMEFEIVQKWGGYKEQEYGVGPELVIAFRAKHS